MIYKLIILIASIFMIYEFTKKRSTAVAQLEPNIAVIYNNQESFKDHFNVIGNLFAGNQLKPQIIDIIQKYDTSFFAWRKSIYDTQNARIRIGVPEYTGEPTFIRTPFEQNYQPMDMSAINAWLKLNGV